MTREVVIPSKVSRSARAVYFAAALAADEKGEVIGGQATLNAMMDFSNRRHVIASLDELEQYGLVRREGNTSLQKVFVLVLDPFGEQVSCEVCNAEVAKIKGARRCPSCLQIQRREWKADLMDIWRNGKRMGWSDMKIAFTAHTRLTRKGRDGVERRIPLWGAVRHMDDRHSEGGQVGRGKGSGDDEGIIKAGVALGIFPRNMLSLAHSAYDGEEGEA